VRGSSGLDQLSWSSKTLLTEPRGQLNPVAEDEGVHVPRTARVGEDAATY